MTNTMRYESRPLGAEEARHLWQYAGSMISRSVLIEYYEELKMRSCEPTFLAFLRAARDGEWAPGQIIPSLVMFREHGFPLDFMGDGWILTRCDVAMVDTVCAGDRELMQTLLTSFAAMREIQGEAITDAPDPTTAARAQLNVLWLQLREEAFLRAVRTEAPCGPAAIFVYRGCVQQSGGMEDMGGLRQRVEMTIGAEPIVRWFSRLQSDVPRQGPKWPGEVVHDRPLSPPRPQLPLQSVDVGAQPSDPRGVDALAGTSSAVHERPALRAEPGGQSAAPGSTVPAQQPDPSSRQDRGDRRGCAQQQPAPLASRRCELAQVAAAQAPPDPPEAARPASRGASAPRDSDSRECAGATADVAAVAEAVLTQACLAPAAAGRPAPPAARGPAPHWIPTPARSAARPLTRRAATPQRAMSIAAGPSHGGPHAPDDLESKMGTTLVKCVRVDLATYGTKTVSIDVSVSTFLDFWVSGWWTSSPVDYGVVKAALRAEARLLAVPSYNLKDPQGYMTLLHLVAWLKAVNALEAAALLCPVPSNNHWALAVVYFPGLLKTGAIPTISYYNTHPEASATAPETICNFLSLALCQCLDGAPPLPQARPQEAAPPAPARQPAQQMEQGPGPSLQPKYKLKLRKVVGVPPPRHGYDCGVYTAMVAETVCHSIKAWLQRGGSPHDFGANDGSAIDRETVNQLTSLKAEHAVLYRMLLARSLIEEWQQGGRGGDDLGSMSPAEARNILMDARWDMNFADPIYMECTEDELRNWFWDTLLPDMLPHLQPYAASLAIDYEDIFHARLCPTQRRGL